MNGFTLHHETWQAGKSPVRGALLIGKKHEKMEDFPACHV